MFLSLHLEINSLFVVMKTKGGQFSYFWKLNSASLMLSALYSESAVFPKTSLHFFPCRLCYNQHCRFFIYLLQLTVFIDRNTTEFHFKLLSAIWLMWNLKVHENYMLISVFLRFILDLTVPPSFCVCTACVWDFYRVKDSIPLVEA